MNIDDPEIAEWLAKVSEGLQKDMLPKMRASAFVMGIVDERLDPYMLMQVGAALLLEKPLILIALKGAWIPKKARELAEEIVEVDSMKTPEAQMRLQQAMGRLVAKARKERQKQ